jgi:hypothetical protein
MSTVMERSSEASGDMSTRMGAHVGIIKPVLTPLAALGFTTIQFLALGFHVARGELAQMAPINLTLLDLSV